ERLVRTRELVLHALLAQRLPPVLVPVGVRMRVRMVVVLRTPRERSGLSVDVGRGDEDPVRVEAGARRGLDRWRDVMRALWVHSGGVVDVAVHDQRRILASRPSP